MAVEEKILTIETEKLINLELKVFILNNEHIIGMNSKNNLSKAWVIGYLIGEYMNLVEYNSGSFMANYRHTKQEKEGEPYKGQMWRITGSKDIRRFIEKDFKELERTKDLKLNGVQSAINSIKINPPHIYENRDVHKYLTKINVKK